MVVDFYTCVCLPLLPLKREVRVSTMTSGGVDVPDELTEDILSRVPVKSLVGFKPASKKWYSLLSDSKFADFHLKLKRSSSSSSSSENRIFFQLYPTDKLIFESMDIDTNESRKFNFPVEMPCNCVLIGSANGLVCVTPSSKGGSYIWNPSTGECKKISVPIPMAAYRVCGFGYDSYSDDYKVVADWGKHFRVFSLKANSWKKLDYSFPVATYALHFNGALHWCAGSYVVTFDFATEQLSYMKLPQELKRISEQCYDLGVSLRDYQGLLCASGEMSVWVMKEYGDITSWAKLTSMPKRHAKPVAFSRLGELVFLRDDRSGIIKSDLQGKVPHDYISHMTYVSPLDTFAYTESLISPMRFDKKMIKKRPREQRKTN